MGGDETVLAQRYVLDHEIGRGGMGAVWIGQDTLLERTVAVKQIGLTSMDAAPDLARAEREAHLAARVTHENVVAVFDLVEEDGRHWMVMEHVDGPSLATMLAEQGPLGTAVVAPVLEQVAGALAASHEHGIVHRDVKPSNILMTSAGRAKLSDFGVARAQADASLTQTGLVTGSPAYISPEVATGRPATAASDVWSLGATMFHALTGRPPYDVGDHLLSTMYSIVHDEPPRLHDGGPLSPLVESMMQQDPLARPTMAEVAQAAQGHSTPALDLEDTQAVVALTADAEPPLATATTAFRPLSAPVDAPRRHVRRRNRSWVVAVAAAAAALVAVVAVGASIDRDDDPADRAASPGATAGADDETSPDSVLEGFAGDYLTAAANDPEAGYALLTPDYQVESGGIDGYRSFWAKVGDLDIESVRGDADRSTVTYRYSYDFEGDRRTEDVTLRLQKSGDGYLVAGTA